MPRAVRRNVIHSVSRRQQNVGPIFVRVNPRAPKKNPEVKLKLVDFTRSGLATASRDGGTRACIELYGGVSLWHYRLAPARWVAARLRLMSPDANGISGSRYDGDRPKWFWSTLVPGRSPDIRVMDAHGLTPWLPRPAHRTANAAVTDPAPAEELRVKAARVRATERIGFDRDPWSSRRATQIRLGARETSAATRLP